jgi:hypothetical protein
MPIYFSKTKKLSTMSTSGETPRAIAITTEMTKETTNQQEGGQDISEHEPEIMIATYTSI